MRIMVLANAQVLISLLLLSLAYSFLLLCLSSNSWGSLKIKISVGNSAELYYFQITVLENLLKPKGTIKNSSGHCQAKG